jgi:acyl dehydratase
MSDLTRDAAEPTAPSAATPDEELRWSAYFDQLRVGQRFSGTPRTVHESDVNVFCALTGDWHPQHCDATWAASSVFGERIAHGLLVLSLAVGAAPLDPDRILALRRVSDVVFKRPVRLEDTITTDGEIAALQPVDETGGLVSLDWTIRNQDQSLVARARFQLLWRSAPASRDGSDSFWHDAMLGDPATGGFTPIPL